MCNVKIVLRFRATTAVGEHSQSQTRMVVAGFVRIEERGVGEPRKCGEILPLQEDT